MADPQTSVTPLPGAGGGSRSGLLDLVRLFSSFDIVAYHTGAALGNNSAFRLGVGMAIFLLMSAVSVGMHTGERPFRPLAKPMHFQPRSTIRLEVEEISVGPLYQGAELFIVFHGFKILGYGT